MQAIARLYDSYSDAAAVVNELESAGIPHERISLIANAAAHGRSTTTEVVPGGGDHPLDPADRSDSDEGAGAKRGAIAGGIAGGVVGLLAGIGLLAIPGVGPVVAAGWLVATLAGAGVGAAGGGLVGALTGAGVSHEEAEAYNEGVKRGGSLVTVQVEDGAEADRIQDIMARRNPVNWQERRTASTGDMGGSTSSGPISPSRTTAATGASETPSVASPAFPDPVEDLSRGTGERATGRSSPLGA
jgi:hypothetical protein